MRLRLAAACLAALALVAPAHGASLSGMGANLYGNYFHFGTRPNLARPPVETIKAGPLRMELQHTRLAEIRKVFGGTIMSSGDADSLANWLCYHTDGSGKAPAADTWFISNILGGGEFVMIVAVQAAKPDRVPADSVAAPKNFALPDRGSPGLGASLGDLKAAFGAASGSTVTYRADAPGADALGTALNAQYIAYVTAGGRVSAYGAGETSVPAATAR
jgi:hypothetical protein